MAFEKELQACEDNLSKLLSRAHDGEINPFRGLEFFDAEHAPFFHGRTKTARKVLDVLEKQAAEKKPFVLVLGPDGSGKTSLVRAGILPVLTQIGIIERGSSWRLALARPADQGSGDPFDALAAPLLKEWALPEFPDAASPNARQNLAAELREAPENAALRLREAAPALDRFLDDQGFEVPRADVEESVELPRPNRLGRVDSKVQLALVVDQLEELFVGGFSPEVQQKYLAALGALVKWRVAFVIAVLQSDFYASFRKCCIPRHLAIRPEFRVRDFDLSEVLAGRFDLPPAGPREIRDMICLPAEATGLRFELDPETGRSLDAALLEAATAHPEPLPLLEHVLWLLYRKQLPRKDGLLRWSDYRESGELERALANHAESVFLALGADAQAALKPVIRQLVSPGLGEDAVLIRRTVPYRDLTSTPEFSEHRKAGAERLIDRFIQEGLFHTEKGPNGEVLVSLTQECLLRNWSKVRQLLIEDLSLLRMRDRLEPNFKLWLSRGRRDNDLLRNRSSTREAKALLRNFRASLSATQVEYLQKSLRAQNRHRWVRSAVVLAAVAGLLAPLTIDGIHWLSADIEPRKAEQSSRPEGKIAHSADAKREPFEMEHGEPPNGAQVPQGNAASATSEREALQARLRDAEAKAQQIQKSLELVTSQRDALQGQLNDTEAKAQQAQKDAALATNQRDALQDQLKESEAMAQQAKKDTALVTNQRDVRQNQLKDSEAKAQQAQEEVKLVTGERDKLQGQLKDSDVKAQQAQKNLELVTSQRDALQTQLKDAETKAQQAQKDAALAASQRDTLQSQVKELTQKNGEFPADDALQTKLNDAEARAQEVQKDAALAASQRDALQNQLKDSEAKAQQAQKDAALATSQRGALQTQLKDTEAKAQHAQKSVELVTSQLDALRNQLKETEAKAQQAQKDAALAASQRDALQTQLKDTEAKAQQAQKNVELVTSQRDALQTQLAGLSAEAQQAQKNKTIGSADAAGPIGVKADPMQKNEPMSRDQEPAKFARIDPSQTAVPPPTPSAAVSLESTPEAQTGGSTKTSTELPLKEFVFEYIRTVASNDATAQTRFFEPRVNYYGKGLLSRPRIQASMERYHRDWPARNWEPKGDPEFPKILHSTNPKLYEVLQPITWTVSNGLQHKQGSTTLYFRIWKNDKGEFHIFHVEQRNGPSESQNN